MKNGQTNRLGKSKPAKVEKASTTLSAAGGIQQGNEPPAGRKASHAPQEKIGTHGYATDNFLRQQFLPLYMESAQLPQDNKITEGVLNSLSILADFQQIGLMDVSDKPYPYNILLAHWSAEKFLRKMPKSPELFIVADENEKVSVATRQTASRSYSLYFIPVLPLYRLLKSREHKHAAKLLLSVYSYLYHIARVPYYRDTDTYLYYHYEIMQEWLEEEEIDVDENDLAYNRRALETALHGGDVVARIIYHPIHLREFAERIESAIAETAFEMGCLKIAKETLQLWQDFPGMNLFCHLSEQENEDEESWSGYDNTIHVCEYVHFIADTESSLYDSIQQNIDAELNEKMYWQEHTLDTVYNETFRPNADTLDYENRLFSLLDNLCYLLNELP